MVKECSKCGGEFPLHENFHRRKSHSSGYAAACKDCERKRAREYHQNNLEKNRERLRKAGREYSAVYHKTKSQKYYVANRASILEYKAKYREENRKEIRERQKRYRKSEKGSRSIATHRQRRRSLSKSVISTLTPEQWASCLKYFNHSCCYCGEKKPLCQDHFIPLSKGGSYTRDNIVPACINCNARKYNFLFSEWYSKYEHFNLIREKKILEYLGYTNFNQQMSIL